MAQEEVAFDDWEAQADKIDSQTPKKQTNNSDTLEKCSQNENRDVENISTSLGQLSWIQKLKTTSPQDFQKQYKNKNIVNRKPNQFPFMLKTQRDFVDLAKIASLKLKEVGSASSEKILPQNEIFTFFQEMIQYLYPSIQWQNLQYTKQKLSIVKKDRKQDEVKAKKLKQKEQRLKRNQKENQNKKQKNQTENLKQKEQFTHKSQQNI